MEPEIAAALIALLGSAIGTCGGIVASSKLTNYRIQQLEKKVEKHNNVMQRTIVLEEQFKFFNEKLDNYIKKE